MRSFKLNLTLLGTLFLLVGIVPVYGQKARHYNLPGIGPHLIHFSKSEAPELQNIHEVLGKYYPMKEGYQWKVHSTLRDEQGNSHTRGQLYFKGDKVLGSMLIAHHRDSLVYEINGHFYSGGQNQLALEPKQAVELAIQYSGASAFMWQDSLEEAEIKSSSHNPEATYYPGAERMHVPKELDFNGTFSLCYAVKVYSIEPLAHKEYYIDAKIGKAACRGRGLWGVRSRGDGSAREERKKHRA